MPQLTYAECVHIQVLLDEAYSHRRIAAKLGRSNRTISREIRQYSTEGKYTAGIARVIRKTRRKLVNTLIHRKIIHDSALEQFILEKIKSYRSPEQIAGRRTYDTGQTISKDTIYRYVYLTHPELIKPYFRRRGKRYRYGTVQADYIVGRKSIHERPVINTIGHREGDTLWGRKRRGGFVTFNEIVSGYLLAGVLEEKRAKDITQKAQELFVDIPEVLKKTLTLDNGREFVEHFMLKPLCGLETYFADPGNPGQRGANENTNGLLRQFYPKGSELAAVSQKQLDRYVHLLNTRPRKRLSWLTPLEFLTLHLCVLLN